MPMSWKKKAILAKIESTYGTDPTPTGSANAIQATNVTLNPMEGEDLSRNLERPYFGGQEMIVVGVYATLTFDVEMVGSGTLGEAPAWGVLHRMCAMAETITASTSVEYDPVSTALESGTIYINIDGTLHKLLGTRGTFVGTLNAQGIPVWRYTFTGLFVQPTDTALPTVDLSAFQTPQAVTKANTPTFTIGGTAMRMRSFELNRGAQVERRFLVDYEGIEIVDAIESVACQVEAVALATYNPYTAPTAAPVAIQLIHGTTAATRVQIDIDRAKQRRPGYANQQNIIEWPLTFDPLPDVGDDGFKITLA